MEEIISEALKNCSAMNDALIFADQEFEKLKELNDSLKKENESLKSRHNAIKLMLSSEYGKFGSILKSDPINIIVEKDGKTFIKSDECKIMLYADHAEVRFYTEGNHTHSVKIRVGDTIVLSEINHLTEIKITTE